MRLNAKVITTLVVSAIISLVVLTIQRCGYPKIDEESSTIFSEAEKVRISCGSVPLHIGFYDSKHHLADLRVIPGSAFLWNESESHRLVVQGISFNGSSNYDAKDGRLGIISFYLNFEGSPSQHVQPPFKEGTYNLSIAMNGVAGIHTVCGAFKVNTRIRFPEGRDLH